MTGACNSDRLFEEYRGMPSLVWQIEDTVSFDVPPLVQRAGLPYLGIRYNDTYEFHNLYVRYLLTDSTGNHRVDTLINIHLFDPKTGKPLGKGYGNVYTKYDTLPQVQMLGEGVSVHFVQYMRKEELTGIEAVGLKIGK